MEKETARRVQNSHVVDHALRMNVCRKINNPFFNAVFTRTLYIWHTY